MKIIRIISVTAIAALLSAPVHTQSPNKASNAFNQHILWHIEPAPDSDWGWLDQSFPMGNGYMRVNLLGGVGCERIQITENSTQDSNVGIRGLNNFAEIYMEFAHGNASMNYTREMILDEGLARVRYTNDGVTKRQIRECEINNIKK